MKTGRIGRQAGGGSALPCFQLSHAQFVYVIIHINVSFFVVIFAVNSSLIKETCILFIQFYHIIILDYSEYILYLHTSHSRLTICIFIYGRMYSIHSISLSDNDGYDDEEKTNGVVCLFLFPFFLEYVSVVGACLKMAPRIQL